MSHDLTDDLSAELNQRKSDNLYRQRLTVETPQGVNVVVQGQSYLSFCSNDYLGLASDPRLITAFKRGADQYGVGSGASHLVSGHSAAHHELEETLADWTGRPRALLFSTGYMANMGALTALLTKQDAVFEDRLNHASLLDGGLMSGARFQRYLHNDTLNLTNRLQRTDARRKLVVSDSVFSMDGDIAPAKALADTCRQHNSWLMLDDAHGLGCLGNTGAGICEEQNLSVDDVPILMGTLGKGIGTAGAFIAGSQELIEYLIQFARSYIYTTAMPPAVAAATIASIEIVKKEHWRRERLQILQTAFREGAQKLGYDVMPSNSPIQPILVGSAEKALQLAALLKQQGILITPIRYPTVAKNEARLRVTLSASHTDADLQRLLIALEQARELLHEH
jgi:8-amino-7-oxononanoate synthase